MPRPPLRPDTNGSDISDRNRFMASNVACCDPVASSPETCVRPAGESEAKPAGMLPVVLKK